jgi:putative DNA primase/helicase
MASHPADDQFKSIPDEMKATRNWVCYNLKHRAGEKKPLKMPYDPSTGERAKANDPITWADFETCRRAFEMRLYDGVGWQLVPPYVGVDLDNCRNKQTGEIEVWALDLVAYLNSKTEVSPSGTGIHIYAKGSLPQGGRRIGRIEMYDCARFFTITGHHVPGTPLTIEERSSEVLELHQALFEEEIPTYVDSNRPQLHGNTLTDAEIIKRASRASNGEKFRALWIGDWGGRYSSQSEADEALCRILAFWTCKDVYHIDALFRQSGLYRTKWERQDYRDRTIKRAISKTVETYMVSRQERLDRLYTELSLGVGK